MDVMSLAATALGALIALAAGLSTEAARSRRERRILLDQRRWDAYIDFALALQRSNDTLRVVSRRPSSERNERVIDALERTGIYSARERVIVAGSTAMVLAAEAAFRSFMKLRDAVLAGRSVTWPDYAPVRDEFSIAIWELRQRMRLELGATPIDLNIVLGVAGADISNRLSEEPS
jgi:hypothetical protein